MSAAGPPQGAKGAPSGAAQRRKPQAWGSSNERRRAVPRREWRPLGGQRSGREPQAWGLSNERRRAGPKARMAPPRGAAQRPAAASVGVSNELHPVLRRETLWPGPGFGAWPQLPRSSLGLCPYTAR